MSSPSDKVIGGAVNDESPLKSRSLFGGAMSIDLPERFVDVSAFRQVPDHQEVFADAVTDESFIIEINQRADVDDSGAAEYHMRDYADFAQAQSYKFLGAEELSPTELVRLISPPHVADYYATVATSRQVIHKYRANAQTTAAPASTIAVHIMLVRLAEQQTDLLLIYNQPIVSPYKHTDDAQTDLHVDQTVRPKIFARALHSMQIRNMDVFDET